MSLFLLRRRLPAALLILAGSLGAFSVFSAQTAPESTGPGKSAAARPAAADQPPPAPAAAGQPAAPPSPPPSAGQPLMPKVLLGSSYDQAVTRLPNFVVESRQDDLVGVASSATQGTVGSDELADRPLLRNGEILETVPGLIITQHAGGGRRTSISCAASTSITAPILRPIWTGWGSICRPTRTGRAMPT